MLLFKFLRIYTYLYCFVYLCHTIITLNNPTKTNKIYYHIGIDTDKHKYPIGSGRVTFSTKQSYFKAITASFIEIKTDKFTKKVR